MKTKKLYIIAGPNGAGKTTASYEILPELWNCTEFVNADEIARGLSPLDPEKVAVEAGRIQLLRIDQLIKNESTFSIETTLATRSYKNLITKAHNLGYKVELLFFYLPSVEDAITRVRLRVSSGGHNIPEDTIRRRYEKGLLNLFQIYIPIVDQWQIIDNKKNPSFVIAKKNGVVSVNDTTLFNYLKSKYGH